MPYADPLRRFAALRYLTTVVLVAGSFAVDRLLALRFGIELPEFLMLYPPVMYAALRFGLGPGFIATGLSTLLSATWYFTPIGKVWVERPSDMFALALFVGMGTAFCFGAERYRRAHGRFAALEKEQALHEERAKLEAALGSMPDAVFIVDASSQFVHVNDAFAKFHRMKSPDKSSDMPYTPEMLDLYLPNGELAPQHMWPLPRAFRGETGTNVEYGLRRKDSGEAWIGSYNFGPIRDEYGFIVGAVASARDVTEIKRAIDELQASEARYRTVFQMSLDPIVISRMDDGTFLDVSRAYTEIVGYSRSEVLGRTSFDIRLWVDPLDRSRLVNILNERKTCSRFETQMRRKNGQTFWATMAASSVVLNGQECMFSIIRDTSEFRRSTAAVGAFQVEPPEFSIAPTSKMPVN